MTRPRSTFRPWGRLVPPAARVAAFTPGEDLPEGLLLPFGNGRSYGDVCTNTAGTLLDVGTIDRIVAFDTATGIVRCQAGVLLSDLLARIVPEGWFLPVTPGTRFVTIGGAIANDVHGKNHHRAGTFGRHVLQFDLLRSDGAQLTCTPHSNRDLYCATIGGLGLTGIILSADIQLKRIAGRSIDVRTTRFGSLSDFFALSAESDRNHEYTVSWIDCLARGRALGRGWFIAGNHADSGQRARRGHALNFPIEPPISLINALTLKAFNTLYYHRPAPGAGPVDYEPFFYPLDGIRNWNRMYGPRGFYQFQCVVPPAAGEIVVRELLDRMAALRAGSFLVVLKQFGELPSPGLLSFPRPGPTLAVDFPNRGARTRSLLQQLETVVMEAGGALYPAKDACMSPEAFQRSYPEWRTLEALRDPAFSSDFWRRVTGSVDGVRDIASGGSGGLQRRSSSRCT